MAGEHTIIGKIPRERLARIASGKRCDAQRKVALAIPAASFASEAAAY